MSEISGAKCDWCGKVALEPEGTRSMVSFSGSGYLFFPHYLALLAADMVQGKPRIPGLRRPCGPIHNLYQQSEQSASVRGASCAEVGCPGYTLVSPAEALVALLDYALRQGRVISFCSSAGTTDIICGFNGPKEGAWSGVSAAEALAAALCKALGLKEESNA